MNDPALKYRDKVDPEHAIAMQSIGLARMVMTQHRARFEELLKARQNIDSIGIVLDPTLYRDVLDSKSLAQQLRMVRAALAFLDQIDEVAKEIVET